MPAAAMPRQRTGTRSVAMPNDAGTPRPRVTAANPSHGQNVAGPSTAGTDAVKTVWTATTRVVDPKLRAEAGAS